MKKPAYFKPVAVALIAAHLWVFCLNDISYALSDTRVKKVSSVSLNELIGYSDPGGSVPSGVSGSRPLSASASASLPLPEKLIRSFHLDPYSGSPVISLPVSVPSGRKGLQPSLTLNYSVLTANGSLGMGWSVDLGCIEVSTRKGIPVYDSTETFICTLGGASMELVPAGGDEYRCRIEGGFMKFKKDGGYWVARDKAGNEYYFGLDSVFSDSSRDYKDGKVFRWRLSQIRDVDGNYAVIKYSEDGSFEMRYTGDPGTDIQNSADLPFVVKAEVEDAQRADPVTSYRSGFKICRNKRLKNIGVFVNQRLCRKYVFDYKYSKKTGRSLLEKITEYGQDGVDALPPMVFAYQDNPEPEYSQSSIAGDATVGDNLWNCRFDSGFDYGHDNFFAVPGPAFPVDWGYGPYNTNEGSWPGGRWGSDANGNMSFNSVQDAANWFWTYVYVKQDKTLYVPYNSDGVVGVWINGDYRTNVEHSWSLKAGYNIIEITAYHQHSGFYFDLNYRLAENVDLMNSTQVIVPQLSCDFNADGLSDTGTHVASSGNVLVALSNGNGFLPKETWATNFAKECRVVLGDFDGDGRTDVSSFYPPSGSLHVALSDGTKFSWNDDDIWIRDINVQAQLGAGDFNGDGLSDIVMFYPNSSEMYCMVAFNKGGRFEKGNSSRLISSSFSDSHPFSGDFNGDGLLDIGSFNYEKGEWKIYVNTGGSVYDYSYYGDIPVFGAKKSFIVADFNSDNITDIGYYDNSTGKIIFKPSNGSTFGEQKEINTSFTLTDSQAQVQAADYNGDGITDYFIYNAQGNLELSLSKGEFPDLLRKVENGIGGTLDFKYASSGSFDNRGGDEKVDLPFVVPVLKESVFSDGQGNSYKTEYAYANGAYDIKNKEFLGFGYVKSTEANGSYAESYFEQGGILKGKVKESRVCGASGNVYSEQKTSWRIKDLSSGLDVDEQSVSESGIYLPYAYRQDSLIYDGESSPLAQTASLSDMVIEDGLVKSSTAVELGDLSTDADNRSTVTEFYSNKDAWIIGLPVRVSVYSYEGRLLNRKRFTYNSKGKVSSQIVDCHDPLFDTDASYKTDYIYDYELNAMDNLHAEYGNLVRTRGPNNGVVTSIYDNKFNAYPVREVNALAQSVTTEYYGVNETDTSWGNGLFGQVKSVADVNGQSSRYTYDSFGRPVDVYGPNDTLSFPSVHYEYDMAPPVKTVKYVKYHDGEAVSENGSIYNTGNYYIYYAFYDGAGRLMQSKSPSNSSGVQVVSGRVAYDQAGRVKNKYFPYYTQTSVSSVSEADLTDIPSVSYDYDPVGRVSKITNPDGTSTSVEYRGPVTESKDELGNSFVTVTDLFGQKAEVREYNAGEEYVTRYDYDQLGNLTGIIDSMGNVTGIKYDSLGRKIWMSDPDMGEWRYEYDASGNLVKQTDAKGQVLEFEYDILNRLKNKRHGSDILAAYYYDESGAGGAYKGKLSRVTYPSGSTRFFYDNLGREVRSVKAISGAAYEVRRAYDVMDRLITLTYPDYSTVCYAYGPQGVVKAGKNTASDGEYVSSVTYHATGQISNIVYGNGDATEYAYDSMLRLKRIITRNSSGESLQDLEYDFYDNGNIRDIYDYRNSALNQSFVYDDLGRLTNASGAYGAYSYAYDPIGNMTSKEGAALTYGKNGTLPHAVVSTSNGVNIDYDANGNMISKGARSFSYDAENRLISVNSEGGEDDDPEEENSSVNGVVSLTLSPGWNLVSFNFLPQDTKISSVLSGIKGKFDQLCRFDTETGEFEYYYDFSSSEDSAKYNDFDSLQLHRGYFIYVTASSSVTLVVNGSAPLNSSIQLKAGYNYVGLDTAGASTVSEALSALKIGLDYSFLRRYNNSTGTFEYVPEDSTIIPGAGYVISVLRDCSLTYSASSSVIVRVFGQTAVPEEALAVSFTYDGDGGRVKQAADSATTTYVGSLFEERSASDGSRSTVKHIYLGDNRVCAVSSTPDTQLQTPSYIHSDHLGSSSIITNASGDVVQEAHYTPYGGFLSGYPQSSSELQTPNSQLTHFFNSKELDSSGLYYYSARYYDPELGRFTQADTIVQSPYNPQTLNRYSYCNNNPINLVDPTGHSWWSKFWKSLLGGILSALTAIFATPLTPIVAGMLAGVVGGATVTALSGGNIGQGALWGMAFGGATGALGWGVAEAFGSVGRQIFDSSVVIASGITAGRENGLAGFFGGVAGSGLVTGAHAIATYGETSSSGTITEPHSFWETAWDIASFCQSVKQFNDNPTFMNGLGLFADSLALLAPGVPGGAGIASKAINKGDDLIRVRHYTNKAGKEAIEQAGKLNRHAFVTKADAFSSGTRATTIESKLGIGAGKGKYHFDLNVKQSDLYVPGAKHGGDVTRGGVWQRRLNRSYEIE